MRIRPALLAFTTLLCWSTGQALRGQITVVDIVPASLSNESQQNSEPNIAVNPNNPNQILISAFGSSARNNPLFSSDDSGATWKVLKFISTSDTSLAWSDSGAAYLAKLASSDFAMVASKITGPAHTFQPLPYARFRPSGEGPDQPWVFANHLTSGDHVYIGFNNLSKLARTASVRLSHNGGQTWRNVVIERVTPGDSFDGAPIRVAANGSTVYAAFERNNQQTAGGDERGEVVVVKDIAGGSRSFVDLGVSGAGTVAATNQVFPQGNLGQERLGSDLSIAVDPNDPNRVFVAYARLSNGSSEINVIMSTDGGSTWTSVYTTGSAAGLPALAIATNGTVGFLFTKFTNGKLETHLVQTTNSFSTNQNDTLSRFTDGNPQPQFDPYIGDYEDLQAVGQTFYGTFCASNNTNAFPQAVTFLRDASLLGDTVPYSIDPFFFTTPAISAP
jgi:hypothetical protein